MSDKEQNGPAPRQSAGREDQSTPDINDTPTPKKRPSHIAYSVRENAEGKAFFNRVGSAFQHKDGNGFDVALDATPVNGRITLRTPKERLDAKRTGQEGAQEHQSQDHDR
ncbi:hypothetical protein QMT40_000383 [Parvibaculaceae bacterium PLY_AMNH_Bact1]|nr:hypothetical protein QMT40_000383 [Parvibaculaceae bacterium PLY_AMNH_Bact1]